MRFEIRQSKRNKQWRAYFITGNNEKIWWTEQYTAWSKADQAVKFLNRNGKGNNRFPVITKYADGTVSQEN